MKAAEFFLSAVMLVAVSWWTARWCAPDGPSRFWLAISLALSQLGVLSALLSVASQWRHGPMLGVQAAALVVCVLATRRRETEPAAVTAPCRRARADAVVLALMAAIAAFLALSATEQWCQPLWGIDERNYHASRAVYWMQHRSIFPFETHNDRDTVFPFLGELVFAWGVLFTKSELVGRMLFWLALPVATGGVYTVARAAHAGRRSSLVAALLFVATPTVLEHACSLKPDLWQAALLLGVAFFALRSKGPGAIRNLLWASLMLGLATSVKTTSLAAAPGLALVAVLAGPSLRSMFRNLAVCAGGGLAGVVLSGFVVVVGCNLVQHRHPLGPPRLSDVVRAETSGHQLYVHAVRLPLFLLELPELPTEGMRQWVEAEGKELATLLHADDRLPPEIDRGWPGHFEFTQTPAATRYSLPGLFWLPVLVAGIVHTARVLLRRRRRPRLTGVAALVALEVPLLLVVVFVVRWMGGGPERFWMGPYALAVPLIVVFAGRWSRRSALVGAACVLLLAWTVYPSVKLQAAQTEAAVTAPRLGNWLEAPFGGVLPGLPPGSRVLLIAGQSACDYPLFLPRQGYRNRVFLWGKRPFDAPRLADLIERNGVTHVVIEDPRAVSFHWAGGIKTPPFVEAMRARADFHCQVWAPDAPVLFTRNPGP